MLAGVIVFMLIRIMARLAVGRISLLRCRHDCMISNCSKSSGAVVFSGRVWLFFYNKPVVEIKASSLDHGRRVRRQTCDSIRHYCHLTGFSRAIEDSVAVCIWHLGTCVVRYFKIKRLIGLIEYLAPPGSTYST